jgi:hypothetical protein
MDRQKTWISRIHIPVILVTFNLLIFIIGVIVGIVIPKQEIITFSFPLIQNNTNVHPSPTIRNQKITEISTWKIYNNKKYGYSIKYPPNYSLSVRDNIEGITIDNPEIIVTEKYPPLRENNLSIKAEKDNFKCANTTVPNGLFSFAASQWGINKNDRNTEITNLSEKEINGIRSFEYSLKGSYSQNSCGGELFDTQQTFVYIERNGNIFLFRYPTKNDIYHQIIETISFKK